MKEITVEIKKEFGTFGKKKLTLTSWNGREAKYDIRDWYENGNAGKGITLEKADLKSLYDLLSGLDFDDLPDTVKPEKKEEKKTEKKKTEKKAEPKKTESKKKAEPKKAEKKTEKKIPKKSKFAGDIEKKFAKLDELFDGFETEKDYGEMPFTAGKRLQYKVKKSDEEFPDYDDLLEELDLTSFVTDMGNLFIYTV